MLFRSNLPGNGEGGQGPYGQLLVGDYMKVYDTTCAGFNSTPVNTNAGATVSLNIDSSCQIFGLYGTLTYTGGGSGNILVQLFADAACTQELDDGSSSGSGPSFNYVVFPDMNGGTWLNASSAVYLRAFYDANGNGSYDAGETVKVIGPINTYTYPSSSGPNITLP